MGFLDRFRKAAAGRSKHYDRAAILALLQENERTGAPLSLREADLSEIDLSGLTLNGIELIECTLEGATMAGVTCVKPSPTSAADSTKRGDDGVGACADANATHEATIMEAAQANQPRNLRAES